MKKEAKKAQTHIEIILSFVIFVGFIFLIFVFLNPLKNLQADYSSLDDIENILLDNVSSTYKSASLILNEDVNKDCISVVDSLGITGAVLVKGISGDIKYSKKEAGRIYMQKGVNERYFTIYFSNSFNEYLLSATGCENLNKINYTFGALNIERTAMLDELEKLNNLYILDYDGLKKNLRIGKDFDFYVLDEDRNSIINGTLAMHKVTARETIVREIPLNAIDANATRYPVIFGIRVW